MKKLLSLALCALLALCASAFPVFADDLFFNTLTGQANITDIDNLTVYNIGFSAGCSSKTDWNLQLVEDIKSSTTYAELHTAAVTAGSVISGQLSCMEEIGSGVIIAAFGADGSELTRAEKGNGEDNAEIVSAELTVPDNAAKVVLWMISMPRKGGISLKGDSAGLSIEIDMTVEGKEEAAAVAPVEEPKDNTPSDTQPEYETEKKPEEKPEENDAAWIFDDKSDEVNSVSDALTELAKGAVKATILAGGAAVGIIAAIIVLIKKSAAKKAVKAGVKAAAKAAKAAPKKTESAPSESAEEPEIPTAPSNSGAIGDSYVVTDPATGAQTLYVKDADGNWVSSDGGSILDTGSLPDWQKQRTADRAWQNKANEGVKKPTKFEDIDKRFEEEQKRIERESYYDQIAVKHGVYGEDMDTVYEKVSHDQARAEVNAEDWERIAGHADTGLQIAQNLKTTADYSVSALGAVTGPAGTVIKDVYAAGTTIGGDVSQAVADGKDGWDVAQAASGAVVKSAVSVIQNHATGAIGKASADIAGGAVTGGIDAYVKGESVGEGIAKGTFSGSLNAAVDTGGEMIGALKDGSSLTKDAKDFISSVTDAGGDLLKNTSGDAVNESFNKTFKELNHRK